MESQPQNPEFRNNPGIFHPCNIFVKMLPAYYICCILSKALQSIFTIEGNTMNPGQSDLGP